MVLTLFMSPQHAQEKLVGMELVMSYHIVSWKDYFSKHSYSLNRNKTDILDPMKEILVRPMAEEANVVVVNIPLGMAFSINVYISYKSYTEKVRLKFLIMLLF